VAAAVARDRAAVVEDAGEWRRARIHTGTWRLARFVTLLRAGSVYDPVEAGIFWGVTRKVGVRGPQMSEDRPRRSTPLGRASAREVLDVSVGDIRNAWRRSPVRQAAVSATVLLTYQAHSVPDLTAVRAIRVEPHMESAPHFGDSDPVGGSA
jgi:hypothetical protein